MMTQYVCALKIFLNLVGVSKINIFFLKMSLTLNEAAFI